MPKINVYLPDELAEAVRAAGLPVSPICQRALEIAVRRITALRETVKLDLTVDDPTARLTNFTERARTAVTLGLQHARDAGSALIETEHLLGGILDVEGNLALQVLRALEIEPDDLREAIAARPPATDEPAADGEELAGLRLAASTATVLTLAFNESISLAHNYVGCEHLLLGLINEPDGGGGEILRSHGAEPRLARRALTATLSGYVYAKSQLGGAQPAATSAANAPGAAALREALAKIVARLDRLEERMGELGSSEG